MNTLTLDNNPLEKLRAIKEAVYVKIGDEVIGHFTPNNDFDVLEDTPEQHKIWGEAAIAARKEGMIGKKASKKLIEDYLNVRH